jgi:hypothetical protein
MYRYEAAQASSLTCVGSRMELAFRCSRRLWLWNAGEIPFVYVCSMHPRPWSAWYALSLASRMALAWRALGARSPLSVPFMRTAVGIHRRPFLGLGTLCLAYRMVSV